MEEKKLIECNCMMECQNGSCSGLLYSGTGVCEHCEWCPKDDIREHEFTCPNYFPVVKKPTIRTVCWYCGK